MEKRIQILLLFLNCFLLAGCYKNHLYVQQEWIDERYLASTRVKTPDPRKTNPPNGQKLLIKWDFPKSLFDQELTLLITVRLWNNTQQVFTKKVERKRDYVDLFFPTEDKNLRILTYKIDVVDKEQKNLETWKHHFWTELIEVKDRKRSSSVSSQPKHESVIDTP